MGGEAGVASAPGGRCSGLGITEDRDPAFELSVAELAHGRVCARGRAAAQRLGCAARMARGWSLATNRTGRGVSCIAGRIERAGELQPS